MVHRSGGTLGLPQNEIQQKPLIENQENLEIPPIFTDPENLPQILDEIESCAVVASAKPATDDTAELLAEPVALLTPSKKYKKARKNVIVSPKRTLLRRQNSAPQALNQDSTQNGNKKLPANRLRTCRLRSNSLGNPRKVRGNGVTVAGRIPKKRGRKKIRKSAEDDNEEKESPPSILHKSNSVGNIPLENDLLSSTTKLTCSVPLEKLSGIMKSIMASSNRLFPDQPASTEASACTAAPATTDDIFGLSSQMAKLLCLYCDKKFTSQKLRIKHTERVHTLVQGRRLSSRNSISCPSILAYPGCSYCSNTSNKLTVAAVSDDLKSLFYHLIEIHPDKYFACRPCGIRFASAELMSLHFAKKHSMGRMSRSASVASSKLIGKRGKNAASPHVIEVEITQPLHVDIGSTDRTVPYEDDENESHPESTPTKTRRQLKQAMENKPLTTRSCHSSLRNDETILSRLGVAQNRLPRGRKGTRNRRLVNMELIKPEAGPSIAKTRTKVGRLLTSSLAGESTELTVSRTATNNRVEPLCCTFDDDFYETVSLNVRQNLSCHLDGKLDSGPTSPSPLSPVVTLPSIRSTVVRRPLEIESEIHEATALAAVTAFPTLLTADQYGSDMISATKIKKPITKHSWKWKWDCVKKYKYVNEGGKIVKKIKHPIAGLRDLSKLDMWTQLTMRTKHEVVRKQTHEITGQYELLGVGEVTREEKRKQIAELNAILDTRRPPQINLEQNEQTVVKIEAADIDAQPVEPEVPTAKIEYNSPSEDLLLQMLQLNRRDSPNPDNEDNLVLSGEWARPRCYICFGCGWKFDKLKKLEEHKISRHPYVYSTHYEMVGRELIECDLYKHLYIPVKALHRHNEYKQIRRVTKIEDDPSVGTCSTGGGAAGEDESMDSVNSLSASTTSATGVTITTTSSTVSSNEEGVQTAASTPVFSSSCTKCKRDCNGQLELYRHMLDCSGDYAWRLAKKRKYRYFGVKSRRQARQNFGGYQRRKTIKGSSLHTTDDRDNSGNLTKSSKCNPTAPRPPRPSDAESIRRMLENLPAKRACRQIIPDVTKPRVRKFTKSLGLKKTLLVNGACNKKAKGKGVHVASTTVTAIAKNMQRNRKRLFARQITRRAAKITMMQDEIVGGSDDLDTERVKPTQTRRIVKRLTQKFQPIKQKRIVLRNASALIRKSKRIEMVGGLLEDEVISVDIPDVENHSNKSAKKKIAKVVQAKPIEGTLPPEEVLEPPSEIPIEVKIPEIAVTDLGTVEIQPLKIDCAAQSLNLNVPSQNFQPPNQISPATKRRGKKLTDCIAKLQEKLGKPFFKCDENLDTVLSASIEGSSVEETAIAAPPTPIIAQISPQITTSDSPKTPKRKTVTRKIIQKDRTASFTVPPPLIVAPPIKVESVEDLQLQKDNNTSMTSNQNDSLIDPSHKSDEPSPKRNSIDLNDSAVSSLATDSSFIQNRTPEKAEDITAVQNKSASKCKVTPKKGRKKISPPPFNEGSAIDDVPIVVEEVNVAKEVSPKNNKAPATPKRGRKVIHYESSPPPRSPPPKLVESMPLLEEALNLTVEKVINVVSPQKRGKKSSITGKFEQLPDKVDEMPPKLDIAVPTKSKKLQINDTDLSLSIEKVDKISSISKTKNSLADKSDGEKLAVEIQPLPVPVQKKGRKSLIGNSSATLEELEAPSPEVTITPESQMKKPSFRGKKNKKIVENLNTMNSPAASLNFKEDVADDVDVTTSATPKKGKKSLKSTEPTESVNLDVIILNPVKEDSTVESPKEIGLADRPPSDAIVTDNAEKIEATANPLFLPEPEQVVSETPITTKKTRGRKKATVQKSNSKVADLKSSEPAVAIEPTPEKIQPSPSETRSEISPAKKIENTPDAKKRGRPRKRVSSLPNSFEEKTKTSILTQHLSNSVEVKAVSEVTTEHAKDDEILLQSKKSGRNKSVTKVQEHTDSSTNKDNDLKSSDVTSEHTKKAELEIITSNPVPPTSDTIRKRGRKKKIADQGLIEENKSADDSELKIKEIELNKDISSDRKTIFDTLRNIQENIYFNRCENSSQTRKYTRKTTKKPIRPQLSQFFEIAPNDSNAQNKDQMAEITLNDSKHFVTASLTVPDQKPTVLYDQKPSTSAQLQRRINLSDTSPNKRRNNRGRFCATGAIARNNPSISKELDEIVASFLLEDEDANIAAVSAEKSIMDRPIRLHDAESLLAEARRKQLLGDVLPLANEPIELENKTADADVDCNGEKTKEILPVVVAANKPNLNPELICKELTITLTKITYSDLQGQLCARPEKSKESTNTIVESIRKRSRRSSTKPGKISLTADQNIPDKGIPDVPASSSIEKKKIGRPVGRRKSVYIEKKEALEMQRQLEEVQKETEQEQEPSVEEEPAPKTVRRRRKNELAAIVADQLLESFKEVDKSRINDLKKLENLAYEKSDDLYVTGMRLTPTTKRKIALSEHQEENSAVIKPTATKTKQRRSKSQPNSSEQSEKSNLTQMAASTTNLSEKDKLSKYEDGNLFQKFAENEATSAVQKTNFRSFDISFGTFRSLTSEFSFGTRKDAVKKSSFVPGSAETSCSVDSQGNRIHEDFAKTAVEISEKSINKSSLHRKLKKKMSRNKKEKKIETENINELRTGLESFTFGKKSIRQFGQKIFGSIGLGMFSSSSKDKKSLLSKPQLSVVNPAIDETDGMDFNVQKKDDTMKKTPLLRPSILSAVLIQESTTTASDAKASRDPRLNKAKLPASSNSEGRKLGSFRQRRNTPQPVEDELNTAFVKPKDKTRVSRRGLKIAPSTKISTKECINISDDSDEEDNCLAAIAQSVNKKIMSEDEEFSQTDGFDMVIPSEPFSNQTLPVTPLPDLSYIDEHSNGEFLHDDDNTNTEIIDMDLEDDMSIYTSFSQDVSSIANKSRFGQKRRRRRSALLTSRRARRAAYDPVASEQTFDCKICNKSFAKSTALAKHQTTFTHVTKLSEYEYLNKLNQPKSTPKETPATESTPVEEKEDIVQHDVEDSARVEPEIKVDDAEEDEIPIADGLVVEPIMSPPSVPEFEADIPPAEPDKPDEAEKIVETCPTQKPPTILAQSGIEPISSPEPLDANYDRYQNTITSRIALSQEERLFYECCNMLKGSETPMVERTYPIVPNTYSTYDVPNKPVTPKSSERFSYLGSEVGGNYQHGTAYTVKSPMSQSRTSPRHAYPKIDINQFSDISSDSNPAFPRVQHPHKNMQSYLGYSAAAEQAAPSNSKFPCNSYKTAMPSSTQTFEQRQQQPERNYQGGSYYGVNNGSGGVGYGPSQFGENVGPLTARTFVGDDQRGKEFNAAAIPGFSSGLTETERNTTAGNEQVLTSPLHSTSSQGSTNTTTTCRMRTKGAMKGYDNFKVSIPTLGLDMQQALERSPHGGCKLTALAEIALGSEVPVTPPRYPPFQLRDEICDKQQKPKPDINEKFAKKYQELIMNNIKPAATTVKKKEICDSIGNKLGFKAKKNKQKVARMASGMTSDDGEEKKIPEKPKDIYEFDESEEAVDKEEEKTSTKGRNAVRAGTEQPIIIPERPFKNIGHDEQNTIKFHTPEEVSVQIEESQMSSTSYSDRDDFNYGSMSENDGEGSENEEDKRSDSESNCSSARTTKTIENKCLIVGRIFKNATKNRPDEKKVVEKVPTEPKKKLPKQELDKLFDSLRKDGDDDIDAGCKEKSTQKSDGNEKPVQICPVNSKPKKKVTATGKSKKSNVDKKPNVKTNTAPKSSGPKSERPSRTNSIDHDFPRELSKLQSELGMTAEDLAELIGEGKRKSQRRCAANRPRTVVETWSSDEYEDFLSTKDIIAFIEEKEKKSMKKRKSKSTEKKKEPPSEHVVNVAEKRSEKETKTAQPSEKKSIVKESTAPVSTAPKEDKVVKSVKTVAAKKPERIVDRLLQKFNKTRDDLKKVQVPTSTDPKANVVESASTVRQTARAKLRITQKPIVDELPITDDEPPILPSENTSQKKPTLSVKPRLKSHIGGEADSESDFESELRRSTSVGKRTSKINKRRKTIAFKEEHAPNKSELKSITTGQGPKLKTSAAAVGAATTSAKTSSNDPQPPTTAAATTTTGRPLARRKRVASEMLYYWSSSSSDEEFGRIETNDDDLTQKGENLPKHGWIVGDSHKKLVTLLATAKGKKVADVKEPASKKKT